MRNFAISLLLSCLQFVSPALGQSYQKGPAYIEGVTTTATAGTTTALTKDSQQIQVFTGSSTQMVVLPNATTLPVGRSFEFWNLSSGAVSIYTSGGGAPIIKVLSANAHSKIILTGNGTQGGTWAVEEITLALTDSLLTGTLPISKGGTGQTSASAAFDALAPSQSTHAGKFLTTNGTTTSWATVDALPTQTGQNGKFLTTNGTAASWANVDALPSQTSNSDKVLTTDGTNASWINSEGVQNFILNPNARFNTTGWATYADAAGTTPVDGTGGSPSVTFVRTTSDPLNVLTGTSFNFNHLGSASMQGQGFSYDFTIGATEVGKTITVTFDYMKYFGTYVSDDVQLFIYDKTAGALVTSQDLPYKLKNHGLASLPARFQFIANSSTLNRQYRLIAHVTSTATSAYTLMFANFKVTRDPGPVQVAQTTFFGGMEQAGGSNCVYSENSSSGGTNFVDLGAGTTCSAWTVDDGGTGTVAAVATNSHQISVSNMMPGRYEIIVSGGIYNQTSSQTCFYRLSDGTNSYQPQTVYAAGGGVVAPNLIFNIPYVASSRTFKIQAADDGAGTCSIVNNTGSNLSWKIKHIPTASQALPNPTQFEFNETDCASAPGVGAVTASMTTNTTTTCKVYRRKNRAYYDVMLTFSGAPNGSDLVLTLQTTIDTAKNPGSASGASKIYGRSNVYDLSTRIYTGNVVGSSSTSVFGTHSESGNVGIINATNPTTLGNGDSVNLVFDVPVLGWVENPMPVLPGSVFTTSPSVTKLYSGVVNSTCSTSPCTLDSGATPGLSITRSGTGLYSVNISPACATNLACSISQSTFSHQRNGASTTSSYPFVLVASGGSNTDGSMSVRCSCQ